MLDALGLGIVANAVLFSYGLSKFFMAMLSDRANARYFLPLGLALSAIVNLLLAFVPILTASVGIFATMMFINGWFQGMGWPPSGRVLVHWFSTNERGWMTSIWNCAHNVGGAGVGILSAWALFRFVTIKADLGSCVPGSGISFVSSESLPLFLFVTCRQRRRLLY